MFNDFKTKYVVIEIDDIEYPIIFPELLQHGDVVDGLKSRYPYLNVVSGGFIDKEYHTAYGESISLKVKSRPDEDTDLIKSVLDDPN